MFKKITAAGISLALAVSLSVPAFGADYGVHFNGRTTTVSVEKSETKANTDTNTNRNKTAATAAVKSFSDVSKGHWAYKPIMNMVNQGIIAGTTTPVNGVGTFSPDAPMTRAQFITVVSRYLYADEIKARTAKESDLWYQVNYDVAVEQGLIHKYEFASKPEVMNVAMSRQEMSMVLVRAMSELGEDISAKIDTGRIPDYNKVGTYYRDFVRVAYNAGLICGVDNAGTFNPAGTLNRAQAAAVLNRLVDASARIELSDSPVTVLPEENQSAQTWIEGTIHSQPQVGDVVIKSDGTRVTLKETALHSGEKVLGLYQGCDIVTGTKSSGTPYQVGDDAPGGGTYVKSELTNEVYSTRVWAHVQASTDPNDKYTGDYDGEIYKTYWKWDAKAYDIVTGGNGYWKWIGPEFGY